MEYMKGLYFCKSLETIRCVYVTKDNIISFLKIYGLFGDYTLTYKNDYAHVRYKSMTWIIKLNGFMVQERDGWASYTKDEFNKLYEIVV